MAEDSNLKHPANSDDPSEPGSEHEETTAFVNTYLELDKSAERTTRKKTPKA